MKQLSVEYYCYLNILLQNTSFTHKGISIVRQILCSQEFYHIHHFMHINKFLFYILDIFSHNSDPPVKNKKKKKIWKQ